MRMGAGGADISWRLCAQQAFRRWRPPEVQDTGHPLALSHHNSRGNAKLESLYAGAGGADILGGLCVQQAVWGRRAC